MTTPESNGQANALLSAQDHAAIVGRLERFHTWLGKRCTYRPEDVPAEFHPLVTNDERSAVEVYDFAHDAPAHAFVYVRRDARGEPCGITTWTGAALGQHVSAGRPYRSAFGDERQTVSFRGINGCWYRGTFYRSAGDYARVRRLKTRAARPAGREAK